MSNAIRTHTEEIPAASRTKDMIGVAFFAERVVVYYRITEPDGRKREEQIECSTAAREEILALPNFGTGVELAFQDTAGRVG